MLVSSGSRKLILNQICVLSSHLPLMCSHSYLLTTQMFYDNGMRQGAFLSFLLNAEYGDNNLSRT